MKIDIIYDKSVASCPEEAAFKACVQGVVNFYETHFDNNVTITWDVGWGEVDGSTIPNGAGAESESNYTTTYYTYAQIKAALKANAVTADDKEAVASLPATDPTQGGKFSMTTAEAKALGLMASNNQIDGWSGLDTTTDWVFNTTNTAGANVTGNEADAFSFLAHELSEVMGRQMNFGVIYKGGPGQGSGYYPYDLYDFSADGVRSFTPTKYHRYFSIDDGAHNAGAHYFNNEPRIGDAFDWYENGTPTSFLPKGAPDSYDWEGSKGAVSYYDLTVMQVLGWVPTGTTPPAATQKFVDAMATFSAPTSAAMATGRETSHALAPMLTTPAHAQLA